MRSLTTAVLSLSLSVSLVACGKKKEQSAEVPAPTASTTPPAPPTKPFTGKLTAAMVMEAAHQIDVYSPDGKPAPFPGALTQAKTILGEPTHVEGTKYQWGVVEGDRCVFYILEDAGGTAKSAGSVGVASTDAECLAATGKAPAAGSAAGSGSAAK